MSTRKPHKTPKIGKIFKREFKGEVYQMTVVNDADGIRYKVDNKIYRSPSAAAKSITNDAVNGWRFWKIGSYETGNKMP